MKKLFTLLISAVMLFTCVFAMSGCIFGNKPELDLESAKANLEDKGYTATYKAYNDPYDNEGIAEYLYAYNNDTDGYVCIYVFEHTKLAKSYYEYQKLEYDMEKEALELEIKTYKTILDCYENDLSSDEIDEIEDSIKDCEHDIEDLEKYSFGRSGNTVWVGNEKGINATK